MDILAIVTLIALILALSMVGIVARLLREERRRSEARVAALSAAASQAETLRGPVRWVTPHTPGQHPPVVQPRAPQTARVDDLDLHPAPAAGDDDTPTPAGGALFGSTQGRPAGSSTRLIAVVSAGALVVGASVAFVVWSNTHELQAETPGSALRAPVAGAPALELVALRHRRDGARLAISGIIRNPSGARPVRNISAVVFLFDSNGAFLSSGRAPVDFTTLAPGDESPFVVVVSEPGAVARYRVSFRSDDRVVPHVDRREPGAPAAGDSAPAVSRTRDAGSTATQQAG